MPTDIELLQIEGRGLQIAHEALAALVENPELLDRARARFSKPPPFYRSPSGSPTQPPSPDRRSPAQKRRERKHFEILFEQQASTVLGQFDAQTNEEWKRLRCQPGYRPSPGVECMGSHADLIVKTRWIEQGIWREGYDRYMPVRGVWKHEHKKEWPGWEPAEERELALSRPYSQFVFQVSKERERIQEEIKHAAKPLAAAATVAIPPDINTTAYERVKSLWTKRNIWNVKWGVLPGEAWKHERPFDEMLEEALAGPETPTVEHIPDPDAPQPISTTDVLANAVTQPTSAGDFNGAEWVLAEIDAWILKEEQAAELAAQRLVANNNGEDALNTPEGLDTKSVALGPVHALRVSKGSKACEPARSSIKRRMASVLEPASPPRADAPRRSRRLQELRDRAIEVTAKSGNTTRNGRVSKQAGMGRQGRSLRVRVR